MDRFLAGTWGKGLLLEYVYLEIMTVLLLRRDLSVATRVGRILLDAEELEFVPCSDLFIETMAIFSNQGGTRLSFADATIASVARSRAGGLILSFDEEFRKIAGLRVNPE
jgi:predicted nucleic acid-binding protein